MDEYRLLHYYTALGKCVFKSWLQGVRNIEARLAIVKRLNRLEQGNLGDHKPCGDGVWELRFANGYRVYYALAGPRILLILYGGTKASQREDILLAIQYWKDWQRRSHESQE